MTRRSESTIQTVDGLSLRRLTWTPDEAAPLGLVVLSHGLGEHVGRYEHVAEAVVAAGFAMSGADHRGHGRSEGLRGHVDGFGEYTADLHRVVQAFRAEHPGAPSWMYGHSMGGLIALSYNLDIADHGMKGFAVTNPQLGLAFDPPKVKVLAGRLLSRVLPRLRLSNELDTKHISRDPAVVRAYEEDPLVSGMISTRWYTSMTAAMHRVLQAPGDLRVPALFLLGGSDKICSAEASQGFARALDPARTTVRIWPNSYHEPHNDLDKAEVLATLTGWLGEQATA
jgi:alpha-beta hydrolase superfamily lysophospholipase